MGVFDFLKKPTQSKKNNEITTKNFFIGAAEAEAEAHSTKIKLFEFFEDFLDIISEINDEKFIITGRKGSGKSAIGEYIKYLASTEANLFAIFIRKNDINIEKIAQIGTDNNTVIKDELIFEWIILTKILDLFVSHQSGKNHSEYNNLKKFLNKNRGFVNLNSLEVDEVIKTQGNTVYIEYFKRFFHARFNKSLQIKSSKAEFYKLIPFLKQSLLSILQEDKNNNSYVIIFDDLDLGYNKNNKNSLDKLVNLLRTAKKYNNEFFAQNSITAKVLILLRNDIARHLTGYADTAKLFATYSVELNWYEEAFCHTEDNMKLKKFIVKRIHKNFERIGSSIDQKSSWSKFIDEDSFYSPASNKEKSGFKYILEHTFFRPRDFILLFKDLSSLNWTLPLSKEKIHILIGKYSIYVCNDLKNELAAVFTEEEVNNIFNGLKVFKDGIKFSCKDLEDALINNGLTNNSEIINELFQYSIIGNINQKNEVNFKFREKTDVGCYINREDDFILHYIIKVYLMQ